MTGIAAVTLICAAGIAIDLGNIANEHRRLQGVADLAAIAAASNLNSPTVGANTTVAANGYNAAQIAAVTPGTYVANPSVPYAQRFTPSTSNVNAVQVKMNSPQALYFSGAFNMAGGNGGIQSSAQVGAQAVAMNLLAASFTLGSSVANLNGGVENAVLGSMLGSSVSLSLSNYNDLANTQINLFTFANALATELNVTGVTYQQLLTGSVTVGQFVNALQLAGAGSAIVNTLNTVVTQLGGASQTIDLSQLLSLGPFQGLQVGSPAPMSATVSAMQLLSLGANIAAEGHQLALPLNVSIPGITSVTATLTVGEPTIGTTMVAVGTEGTTVHTAQTRLFLKIGLLSTLSGNAITLPLYLELGSATATLSTVSCNVLDGSNSSVTLAVTPSLASLWIANVTPSLMTDYDLEPNPVPAPLVSVPVPLLGSVAIDGYASAQITNTGSTAVLFSQSDIQNDVMHTTSTQDFFQSLFSSALGGLQLTAWVGAAQVPLPPAASMLGATLANASSPVDTLVTELLQSAGASLGNANSWVTGMRCATAVVAQ